MKNEDIIAINRGASDYPAPLQEISVPPTLLYCRGDLSLLNGGVVIAVVGTRTASKYGVRAAEKIVKELVSYGVIIVSGLAFGIDAAAHRAALGAGGKTIAVLPGGIDDDSIYPRVHLNLAREISAKGLLVSEEPSGSQIWQSSFLARNRIIAGLCAGTVVVEAAARSGALMTARYARDENRGVYAVPGSIFNSMSEGTNLLLGRGGVPVQSAEDILKDLNLLKKLKRVRKALSTSSFTDTEKVVLECIHNGVGSAEEIIKMSAGSSKAEIITAISMLELEDMIILGADNQYYLNK